MKANPQVRRWAGAAALLLGAGGLGGGGALAQTAVPTSGLYIGAGGSINVARFDTQNTYFAGVSDAFQNGVRVLSGAAEGPARNPIGSDVAAAPNAQIGYYRNFRDSRWLWGAKASYSYLGASASASNSLLPQFGGFTTTDGTYVPFTGNGVARSYQMRAQHQVTLTPFLGYTTDRGFLYLGGGPTLTRIQTDVNGLIGFADINGQVTNVSGPPQNFSSAGWVWGGMVIAGVTWFLTPDWFLDFAYTASATQRQSGVHNSPFINTADPRGVTQGSVFLSTSGGVVIQGATLTLNRRF
ncbi:outer membrane protein [Sediminicoccus sp. BL-A-41-H5]|uniref:outer membrane protein n=1 Tax=Sediminicoccus sp. BL-A-41-H5 TaxID=3421106 RepID=UPI003D66FB6E